MEIEWKHLRCIACLKADGLSLEHVIPESLGGILTSRFLCRLCNSKFGSGFEAKARLAPELRKAASGLGEDLSELKDKLERGAEYQSRFEDITSKSRLRGNGQMGPSQLEDGSLIFPELDAPRALRSIMQKCGVLDPEINSAIARWKDAPVGLHVDLGAGITIKKWQEHPKTPSYTEPPLSPLVALKAAYEFAALLVGGSIYGHAFDPLRSVLYTHDRDMADNMVTFNWASAPDAFHGISFEGNHEVAQFQVRFFGLLAYTVRFPKVAIKYPPTVYTHRLDTGDDWAHQPDEAG